ncbi:MAG: hypothetical protein ACFFER_18270 [Candidatus Thorarchaeota archaeon]
MLSVIWTDPILVTGIQVIAALGFLFLGLYTLVSYSRVRSKALFLIGVAFFVISASIIMKITVLPQAAIIGIEEEYLEAMVEGVQFVAGFLFFYGLRGIGRRANPEVETNAA